MRFLKKQGATPAKKKRPEAYLFRLFLDGLNNMSILLLLSLLDRREAPTFSAPSDLLGSFGHWKILSPKRKVGPSALDVELHRLFQCASNLESQNQNNCLNRKSLHIVCSLS